MADEQSRRRGVPDNSYYAADVGTFLRATTDEILGALAARNEFALDVTQRDAWVEQISVLQDSLANVNGSLFLEWSVPRIGSRIDVVLVSADSIFVVEFKVGESTFLRSELNQVCAYALDLKYFHKGSHNAHVVPTSAATSGRGSTQMSGNSTCSTLIVCY